MWKPKLCDVGIEKGSGRLLWEAREKMLPLEIQDMLSDNIGLFAMNTNKGVLCAKKCLYGSLVSCHMRAVVSAKNQGKPLLMYVKSIGSIYRFNPDDIFDNNQENVRGGETMLNFPIRLGERVEVLE